MTAVAGFVHEGKVWIGGDSAGVSGTTMFTRADEKVFRNGEFIFGFTSSFRMGQLLRYSFKPPVQKENQNIFDYMVTTFVDAVRECLKAGGFSTKLNEVETGGTFLVGYRGHLFGVEDDYQIVESIDGHQACGSGRDVAHGALHVTRGMAPAERMIAVLGAAERFTSTVRAPFHIESS